MSRILTAHQPNYLPWLGLFHRIGQADVWIIADDVQYTKHGLINRNRIRTAEGWQWLTVPVLTRGRGLQRICDVEIDTVGPWCRKHWQALQWNYHRASCFGEHEGFLETFYREDWRRLVDVNLTICRYLQEQLRIEVEIHRSSELKVRGDRNLRLVDMALACGCDVYLAGAGASRRYLDREAFEQAGIECRFSTFCHPTYRQCFPGFEPHMSVLDLLLNHGTASREILFGVQDLPSDQCPQPPGSTHLLQGGV